MSILILVTFLTGATEGSVDVTGIDVEKGTIWIGSHEVATFNVTINITADGGEADIYVNLSDELAGWSSWVEGSDDSHVFENVSTTQQIIFNVIVDPDSEAEEDDQSTTDISVQSSNGTNRLRTVKTKIRGYSISVAFPTNKTKVSPVEGDNNETLQFDVENTGDGPDDIEIRISETPGLEGSDIEPGELNWISSIGPFDDKANGTSYLFEDLEANTPQTVFLEFDVGTIPVDAEAGEYSFMVHIESKGAAHGDPDANEYVNITLEIEKVAGFEWTMDMDDGEIDPTGLDKQDEIDVPITIHNQGNFDDAYKVETVGLSPDVDVIFGWHDTNPATFNIDSDQEAVVTMVITVDEDILEGWNNFTVRISSSDASSETRKFNLSILAPDIKIADNDITLSENVTDIEENDDVLVHVRIWNNGSGPVEDLVINFIVGSTWVDNVTIEEIGADRWEDIDFNWTIGNTTDQTIKIQTDGAKPDELNVIKTFSFPKIVEEEPETPEDDEEDKGGLTATQAGVAGLLVIVVVVVALFFLMQRKK